MGTKKSTNKTDTANHKQKKKVAPKNPPHLFKPGQSGNPAGRPKGSYTVAGEVKRAGSKLIEEWFTLIFLSPESELLKYEADHQGVMSRATRVILENSENVEVIDRLLNRVVPMPKPSDETPGKDKTIEEVLKEARERINAQGEVASGTRNA